MSNEEALNIINGKQIVNLSNKTNRTIDTEKLSLELEVEAWVHSLNNKFLTKNDYIKKSYDWLIENRFILFNKKTDKFEIQLNNVSNYRSK